MWLFAAVVTVFLVLLLLSLGCGCLLAVDVVVRRALPAPAVAIGLVLLACSHYFSVAQSLCERTWSHFKHGVIVLPVTPRHLPVVAVCSPQTFLSFSHSFSFIPCRTTERVLVCYLSLPLPTRSLCVDRCSARSLRLPASRSKSHRSRNSEPPAGTPARCPKRHDAC